MKKLNILIISFLYITVGLYAKTNPLTSKIGTKIEQSGKKSDKQIPPHILTWLNSDEKKSADDKPFFHTDTTYLRGYIQGYDSQLGFSSGILHYRNEIYDQEQPVVFNIESDGRFSAAFVIDYPASVFMSINDRIGQHVYFVPGKTTSLSINWDDAVWNKNTTVFYASTAKTNMGFQYIDNLKQFEYEEYKEALNSLTPDEIKGKYLKKLSFLQSKIAEYIQKENLSAQDSILLQHYIKVLAFSRILNFQFDLKRRMGEVSDVFIDKSFYSFIKDMPLNEPELLSVPSFSSFFNRLAFIQPISHSDIVNKVRFEFIDYLHKNNLLSEIEKETKIEHPDGRVEIRFSIDYVSAMNKNIFDISVETDRMLDSIAVDLGLAPSLLYDMIKIHSLNSSLELEDGFKNSKENALKYTSLVSTSISNAYMREKALMLFLEKFPVGGQQSYPIPSGKGGDLMREIMAPYKGKLVLVDFWGTSCGPCIAAIKSMASMREEMKNNPNVAFVFITSNLDSPESAYNKFIEENKLDEHGTYYLSNDNYLLLRELFKFNGIPHYVLIDRNGNIIKNNYFPSAFQRDVEKFW